MIFHRRKTEDNINSFPNFTLPIKDDDGFEFNMHFVALFSEREDAIPIAFYHGWPGSFLEFLPMMNLIKKKYSAADLPYHIIAPSLPGYAFSSGPPTDKDFNGIDMPRITNKLMHALGFGSGYITQGGDLGSMVARQSAVRFPECKAFHLNMNIMTPPKNASELPMDEIEKKAFPRGKAFNETGSAYAREHGTRTATIGLVLSSNPLALLAWIGEKFLEWTDTDPELDEILDSVTLYWLTETYARCIYPYRDVRLIPYLPSSSSSFCCERQTDANRPIALRRAAQPRRRPPHKLQIQRRRQTNGLLLVPERALSDSEIVDRAQWKPRHIRTTHVGRPFRGHGKARRVAR